MPVRLRSLDGRENIPLDLVLVVVGRHADADARLDSSRVSRCHCCLVVERRGVLVRDLGSRNGTRINGRRVRFGLIRRGDELRIAHLRYRLEIDDDTAEAVPVTSRDAPGPDGPRYRDLPVPSGPEGDSATRR
jgi:pSer/pThr/pTyr-binding forkhead associated (FHA) protein